MRSRASHFTGDDPKLEGWPLENLTTRPFSGNEIRPRTPYDCSSIDLSYQICGWR